MVLENQVRDHAYFLWENAGRPEGSGEQFWLQAEDKITNRDWLICSGELRASGKGKLSGVMKLALDLACRNNHKLGAVISASDGKSEDIFFQTKAELNKFGIPCQ